MVAHTCNPSTLGGQGRQFMRSGDRDNPGQHSETPSLLKYKEPGVVGRACNKKHPKTNKIKWEPLLEPLGEMSKNTLGCKGMERMVSRGGL